VHRFEVTVPQQIADSNMTLSITSAICNPAVDEVPFSSGGLGLSWLATRFHVLYQNVLFVDAVKSVMSVKA
jgi:hypothetical protein